MTDQELHESRKETARAMRPFHKRGGNSHDRRKWRRLYERAIDASAKFQEYTMKYLTDPDSWFLPNGTQVL